MALRYSDLPESVDMTVPSPTGFAAMKLMAWFDRQTPRDLYDLAALAHAGQINDDGIRLVKNIAGYTPSAMSLGTDIGEARRRHLAIRTRPRPLGRGLSRHSPSRSSPHRSALVMTAHDLGHLFRGPPPLDHEIADRGSVLDDGVEVLGVIDPLLNL